jgi:hypothetical protein
MNEQPFLISALFLEVGEVVKRSGGQIVDDVHFIAIYEIGFRQVGTDKPGAAGESITRMCNAPVGRPKKIPPTQADKEISLSRSRQDHICMLQTNNKSGQYSF